jgi:regulator of replication initiation timing
MKDEPLMNLRPKTIEERLLWASLDNEKLTQKVKDLNFKIGILNSEIDEIKHLMKQEEKGALILKNKKLTEQIKDKENRIKDLKRDNELFLQKIIKLQAPK